LAAPTGGKVNIEGGFLTLTWNVVPGASVYRIERSSSIEPATKLVATGLTTELYQEPAPDRGELLTFTIYAVGPNGAGTKSDGIKAVPREAIPKND
jgi:hypothetical protein